MLREAAASVLGQTLHEIELIIALNSATPETAKVAAEFAADPRVRVISIAKAGVSRARNEGIKRATGVWVAFLDDDDLWAAGKLARQIQTAEQTGADMITCDFIERGGALDGIVRRIRPPAGMSLAEAFMFDNYGAGGASSAMVKRSVALTTGGFDPRLSAGEDWDFWRRISWRHKIIVLDEALTTIRRHRNRPPRSIRAQMVRHLIKQTFDTPRHLRHLVVPAWKAALWIEAGNLYCTVDRISAGRLGRLYRRFLKPAVR